MIDRLQCLSWRKRFLFIYIFNGDLFGICQSECQLVAVDAHLNRIAHRGIFHHGDLCFWNDTHIQKMLTQGTFTADGDNGCGFSDRKFF